MSRTFQIAAALAVATAMLAPVASADPGGRTTSINVSHADLDLTAKAGARTLLTRMRAATAKVCGPRPAPHHIHDMTRYQACTEEAMAAAVAAIDIPTVTALFKGQAGTALAAR